MAGVMGGGGGVVVGATTTTITTSSVTTSSTNGQTITSTIPVTVTSGTTVTTTSSSTTPTSTTPTTTFTPSTSVTVVTAVITSTVSGSQVVQTTQSTSSIATLAPANSGGGSSGLSGGAKTGVIVGSVVGGVLALGLLGFLIFCCVRRSRNSYTPGEDEIRWPQADADADQLYPAAVRETRGHGMLERGDSLRSAPNDASDYSGRSFAAVGGAGVAGVGTGAAAAYPAYAAAPPSTYYGQSTQDHSAYGQYADVSSAGGDPYAQAAYSQETHSPRPLSGAYSMSEVSQPHMPAGAGAAGVHRNGSIAESTWRSADAYRGNLKVTNE